MKPPVLEIEDLHRSFGDREVLRGISFSVRPGEIYALLGPNGAGKTTTLRIVLGLLEAHGGSVSIDRLPLTRHRARLLRRVGFMLEQPKMIPELTLEQNLRFFASIYRLPNPKERIDTMVHELGLDEWRTVPLNRYSKGMSQKAALGRAVLHDPSILILDEPLAGLDPIFQEDFRGRIQRLRAQGKALLLSSHDLNEVERLCTHVGMLYEGHLVASGSIDEIRSSSGLRKFRFCWEDPVSVDRAATILERCHHVRRDHSNPRELAVVLPATVDPQEVVRSLSLECDEPSRLTPIPITLEDIFLSRMRSESACGEPTMERS